MAVDEARRLALHDAAAHNRWTPEVAVTLMELLPPTGWGDVATRQHVDLRFQIVDQRLEALEAHFDDRLDARLAQSFNQTIRWTVATMIALTGVTATIATMIARLG